MKKIQLSKLSALALTLAVSSSMVLTACDTKQNSTETEDKQATATTVVTPATDMAQTTLNNISMITYMYRSAEGVTDEQKACLDNIDMKETVPELANLFSDNFTKEELQQTVDLYNKPEVKQVTKYALQMAQQASGVEVKDLAPAPSADTMKIVQEFGQSEIGQKLNDFTAADDLIQNAVSAKVKACGIDPKM